MGVSQGGRNIVLEFPSREQAEAWYHSKAYQSIIQSKEQFNWKPNFNR
jgi:uncharacterized protein (DUF1330 family)